MLRRLVETTKKDVSATAARDRIFADPNNHGFLPRAVIEQMLHRSREMWKYLGNPSGKNLY
jgi:hypothetical protein